MQTLLWGQNILSNTLREKTTTKLSQFLTTTPQKLQIQKIKESKSKIKFMKMKERLQASH